MRLDPKNAEFMGAFAENPPKCSPKMQGGANGAATLQTICGQGPPDKDSERSWVREELGWNRKGVYQRLTCSSTERKPLHATSTTPSAAAAACMRRNAVAAARRRRTGLPWLSGTNSLVGASAMRR